MTDNQQIALILSVWLVFSIIVEILLAIAFPWGDRDGNGDDPPPIVGGLLIGALATIAVGLLWGIGYGMYWLWTH